MVLGIASEESEQVLESYRSYYGLSFPILMDTDRSVEQTYAQEAAFWSGIYPQDWIVDREGLIAYANNGYEPDEIVAIVEEQLASD